VHGRQVGWWGLTEGDSYARVLASVVHRGVGTHSPVPRHGRRGAGGGVQVGVLHLAPSSRSLAPGPARVLVSVIRERGCVRLMAHAHPHASARPDTRTRTLARSRPFILPRAHAPIPSRRACARTLTHAHARTHAPGALARLQDRSGARARRQAALQSLDRQARARDRRGHARRGAPLFYAERERARYGVRPYVRAHVHARRCASAATSCCS
jgi:hypothetical protein